MTSSSLLVMIAENDQVAWRRLVRLYTPLAYSWCQRWGVPRADADDVVQEVFVTIHRAITSFEHTKSRGTFRGWMRSLTRSRVMDFHRKQRRTPKVVGGTTFLGVLEELPDEVDEGGDPAELMGLYQRALELIRDDFAPASIVAFERTAMKKEPAAEVASDLGLSRPAVYQAKHRVLGRLRQEFQELLD